MVERPIRNRQTSSTPLRPCVSPQWPSTNAPIGPRDVADPVGRERGDDGDGRIARREEDLRKDERGRRRIDEEVVVFERRADPAARGGGPALVPALGSWMVAGAHVVPPCCLVRFVALVLDLRDRPQLLGRRRRKAEEFEIGGDLLEQHVDADLGPAAARPRRGEKGVVSCFITTSPTKVEGEGAQRRSASDRRGRSRAASR